MAGKTSEATFETIIERHRDLIANILAGTTREEVGAIGVITPKQFTDAVELASDALAPFPQHWKEDHDALEAAHRHLVKALDATDTPTRATQLRKANKSLNEVDPTDFLG